MYAEHDFICTRPGESHVVKGGVRDRGEVVKSAEICVAEGTPGAGVEDLEDAVRGSRCHLPSHKPESPLLACKHIFMQQSAAWRHYTWRAQHT